MPIPFPPLRSRSRQLLDPRRSGSGLLLSFLAASVSSSIVCAPPLESVVLVCDSTDDRVLAFEDRDGSGAIEPESEGEIRIFYDDTSPGPDLSSPSHMIAADDGRVFLLDGGTLDAILILADKTGDGDANDEGEIEIYYSSDAGAVTLGTPNTLVRGPDGALFLADDGSRARRIVRLEDLNGDGDAVDEQEARVVYDATALSSWLPQDVESLAFGRDGTLYVGESSTGAVFRLSDGNGDGDYLDEDEVDLFFQSDEDHPLVDIDCLAVVETAVFACDEDSGTILRLEDGNDDGLIEAAAGELSVYLDHSSALRVSDTNDFVVLPGRQLLILDGKLDTLFIARDGNGDGDALDDDEVRPWLLDGGESLSTPSGIAVLPGATDEVPYVFVRGDVSGDGRLDLSDAVALLGVLFLGEAPEVCDDVLDSDDNGTVNIADAVMLLNFLFAGGTHPPAPFPLPGADPTEDALDCEGQRPA